MWKIIFLVVALAVELHFYLQQNVLKIDKSNYHALVFIGLCAKEMEQFEQSRAAYQKAIDQNSEQLLAWQVSIQNLYTAF